MLDRLHTELQTLLPDSSQAKPDGPYTLSPPGLRTRSSSPPHPSSSNSIVTSVFGGTLQSEVKFYSAFFFFYIVVFVFVVFKSKLLLHAQGADFCNIAMLIPI